MDAATVAQLRAELAERTMYELLGGEDGLRTIVDRFYDRMGSDPEYALIREMHQADLAPMRRSLFEFLSGWLGGPPLFLERTGSVCLTEAHAPYTIDQAAHDQWLDCMSRAMADAGLADRYREALLPGFESIAGMLRRS